MHCPVCDGAGRVKSRIRSLGGKVVIIPGKNEEESCSLCGGAGCRDEGRYSTNRYVASFAGFAPWDHPEVLCLVVIEEPTASIFGGGVAAPVFKVIADAREWLQQ